MSPVLELVEDEPAPADHVASATVVAAGASIAEVTAGAVTTSASVPALDAHPTERGFDDDEAPFPPGWSQMDLCK